MTTAAAYTTVSGVDPSQLDVFSNGVVPNVDHPLIAFFGYPNAKFDTTALDAYNRTDYTLPEAYVGKNLSIGQTLDEMSKYTRMFYVFLFKLLF